MPVQYGVDVGAARLDDLDKRVLAWVVAGVAHGQQPTVLDLGCGSGGLAGALAEAGAQVTAVDIADYQTAIDVHNVALPVNAHTIRFVQAAIGDFVAHQAEQFGVVVLQRVLHYLPYDEAVSVLETLRTRTTRLFLSVTGVESEIGQLHLLQSAPLFERFACLPPEGQATYCLTAPVCVYRVAEFRTLLDEAGWEIEDCWTSDFGNHKAVATPRSH
jgi:SAM-dependent methyltransferase